MEKVKKIEILIVSIIIFSCSYILTPFIIYDQGKSIETQASLFTELKKIGVPKSVMEIYVEKEKRLTNKRAEIKLIFPNNKESINQFIINAGKKNWEVEEKNDKKLRLVKGKYFIVISYLDKSIDLSISIR